MILCLETSASICSVAIGSGSQLIAIQESISPNDHASMIITHVQNCLKEADLTLKDIEAIAVSQGPGSFTGLRVGVSAAKGLCYAMDIPMIAISTLSALAWRAFQEYPDAQHAIAMIEARKNEVFGAVYGRDLEMELSDQVITLYPNWHQSVVEEWQSIIFCGPGCRKYHEISHPTPLKFDLKPPSAMNLVELAFEKHIKKDYCVAKSFSPNYIKLPHITQPRKVL